MSNAPERIWAWITGGYRTWYYNQDLMGTTEYARADTIEALRTENERLQRLLVLAQWSLQPFSDCVFNDNGDCTVSDTHNLSSAKFVDAYRIYRAIRAALTEKGEQGHGPKV